MKPALDSSRELFYPGDVFTRDDVVRAIEHGRREGAAWALECAAMVAAEHIERELEESAGGSTARLVAGVKAAIAGVSTEADLG